jgi:hypothetical protein
VADHFSACQRAWRSAADVPAGSAVGRQPALAAAFAAGEIPPGEFALGRLAARQRSMAAGERVGDTLARALRGFFSAVEDLPTRTCGTRAT